MLEGTPQERRGPPRVVVARAARDEGADMRADPPHPQVHPRPRLRAVGQLVDQQRPHRHGGVREVRRQEGAEPDAPGLGQDAAVRLEPGELVAAQGDGAGVQGGPEDGGDQRAFAEGEEPSGHGPGLTSREGEVIRPRLPPAPEACHMGPMSDAPPEVSFSGPEMGALAHLYRGEVYRSTIWRTRLDATTNWSVVSLGLALTISYQSPEASALPLFLVGFLIGVFLYLESRRYRYFNVWRARARWLEINFYAPMLRRTPYDQEGWCTRLAEDYERPEHHIRFRRAIGRRLRRNYMWIFSVQMMALFGKVFGAGGGTGGWSSLAIGQVPGWAIGAVAASAWAGLAVFTYAEWRGDKRRFKAQMNPISMG